MAKRYRVVERDQGFLMAPDMREWLPSDHPVWLMIALVERMDTSGLDTRYRLGGAGAAAYDPQMLFTVLVWGWLRGERSSRRLERLCREDVSFRVICAGHTPDHVTLSRFRAGCAEVAQALFAQVLVLCAQLGMGRVETVALDGVKIAANASLEANRSPAGLQREAQRIAARVGGEHADRDAEEDALFGPGRGDELPVELVTPSSRAARIRDAQAQVAADQQAAAAAATATDAERERRGAEHLAERERAQRERAAAPDTDDTDDGGPGDGGPGDGDVAGPAPRFPPGRAPGAVEVQVAEQNLAAARAAQQVKIDSHQRRWGHTGRAGQRGGSAPKPVEEHWRVRQCRERLTAAQQRAHTRAAARDDAAKALGHRARANITDPDSRLMPLRGGAWLQGYNCQAVTSADGLVLATSVSNNPTDTATFPAMMDAAVAAAEHIARHRPDPSGVEQNEVQQGVLSPEIELFLADAGYFSVANLEAPGPDRLIAPGKARDAEHHARTDPATGDPAPDAGPTEIMCHRMRTVEGITAYRQRGHIAETTFAQTKHNRGLRRFLGRGLSAVTGEWALNAAVHNLGKLLAHTPAAAI